MTEKHRDSGSVLMLFPAAFLIILALGAIAIDSGVAFLYQRELASAAGAAANDAIAMAVDPVLTRTAGQPVINPDRFAELVHRSLERRGILEDLTEPPQIIFIPPDIVEVRLVGWALYVISPALPGNRDGVSVSATATARLIFDDGQYVP